MPRRRASEASAGGEHPRRQHRRRASSDAAEAKEQRRSVHAPSPLPAAGTAALATPAQPKSREVCSPIPWEKYSPTAAAAAAELSAFKETHGGAAAQNPAAASVETRGEAEIPAPAGVASVWAAGTAVQAHGRSDSPAWQPPHPEEDPPPLQHPRSSPAQPQPASKPGQPAVSSFQGASMQLPAHLAIPVAAPPRPASIAVLVRTRPDIKPDPSLRVS